LIVCTIGIKETKKAGQIPKAVLNSTVAWYWTIRKSTKGWKWYTGMNEDLFVYIAFTNILCKILCFILQYENEHTLKLRCT